MYVEHVIVTQATSTGAQSGQSATERGDAALSREQLKVQIRENIIAAQEAAREAASEARDAAQQARDAENQVRIQNGQPVLPPKITTVHTGQGPIFGDNFIPPQVVDIAQGFFAMCAIMVVGWPLARAIGRRLEKGGGPPVSNPAMTEQLQRIEQAVDAMSIEIERISESQRFLTKLQSAQSPEQVALPGERR